tara:strand:+ start:586 stop:945 length:360 start_codon:yes stop_codon:yes gene_type:complete
MLTPEEVLLFQAVRDEEARQLALQGGTAAGAGLGLMAGLSPTVPYGTKLGARRQFAGGLTGLILGGGLGAGTAAMMKVGSEAGELLGKLQAQRGQLSDIDTQRLGTLLGEIYQNPSQIV